MMFSIIRDLFYEPQAFAQGLTLFYSIVTVI